MDNIMNQLPWDVKSAIGKVKNAVLNYTEMESKVREATNSDAWGAATTLLQEIAAGTNQYRAFNEIMPMIYKRFAESKNWRQIYKTLQLVEYLLKNGSDRVIDHVRDHIYDIKTLTTFQFVDEKGKDQGINVRHRAKEIIELINDTDRLRAERDKAKANKNKYTGVAAEQVRYGGFGSDSYSSQQSSSFGNSGSYVSRGEDSAVPTGSYEAAAAAHAANRRASNDAPKPTMPSVKMADTPGTAAAAGTAPAATSNLLDVDFGSFAAAPPATSSAAAASSWDAFGSAAPASSGKGGFGDNGGFADFQSAAPAAASAQFANFASFAPAPQSASQSGFGSMPVQPPAPASSQFGAFNFANLSAQSPSMAKPMSSSAAMPSGAPQWPAASMNVVNAGGPSHSAPHSAAPKTAADALQSNLAALDSLSKYNVASSAQSGRNGPALNQLGATSSPAAAPQLQPMSGWGSFSSGTTGTAAKSPAVAQQQPWQPANATSGAGGALDDLLL